MPEVRKGVRIRTVGRSPKFPVARAWSPLNVATAEEADRGMRVMVYLRSGRRRELQTGDDWRGWYEQALIDNYVRVWMHNPTLDVESVVLVTQLLLGANGDGDATLAVWELVADYVHLQQQGYDPRMIWTGEEEGSGGYYTVTAFGPAGMPRTGMS